MTDVPAPPNLAALRAIRDPAEQARAASRYISEREQAIREARIIRDNAVRLLAKEHGPTRAAALSGVSVSLVKVVTRPT